jgi:methyl-accepting chemotaxis protein-1 (serine sensor receptor)
MNLSRISVKNRLLLLGFFTNGLLIVAVCLGAFASWRVSQRFDGASMHQASIAAAAEQARGAQADFRDEVQEFSSLLLRAPQADARERHRHALENASAGVDRRLAELERTLPDIGLEAASARQARESHTALVAKYREALRGMTVDAAGIAAVDAATRGIERAPRERLEALDASIRALAAEQLKQDAASAEGERLRTLAFLGIVTAFTLVASTLVGLANSRSIVPPLQGVVDLARSVAGGDLTQRIETDRRDEMGHVLRSLKEMNASLLEIVTHVQEGAQAVMSASAQIAASNYELSGRTESQASSLEQTAASIEEMTAAVDQNAQHARRANELAATAAEVARRGGDMVQKMVVRMEEIQSSSRKISEIIGLIDSIAFQTNILALNAAVEAARAGESGRGFAVVATEVRNLAQRSADAARQIKELIGGAVDAVNAGAALADDAGRTMENVTSSVTDVSAIIGQIASATSEQQVGISQINQAVTELDRVTQKNASMAQESTEASQALKRMAERLEQAVSFFKVHAGTQAVAKAAALPALGCSEGPAPEWSGVEPAR